jgi:pyruvate dehydrogenase E1 component alpha subunit
MHMSAGSEAIAAGVCQALGKEDQVLCSYRSHSCYLAKTEDTNEFFLEMYGKELGGSHGKAGSMHLTKVSAGHIMSAAIVASHLSVASGIAFANKRLNNNKICAVFFGDGALEEGTFWETLNLSCLMKLPILFVCEDNGLAVHTDKKSRKGYNNIDDIVSKFNCNVFSLSPETSTDVEQVYEVARIAVRNLCEKPSFLRIPYYRYLEHVGINEDFHRGYRSKDEFEEWNKIDPVKLMRDNISVDEAEAIEQDIYTQVECSISLAKRSPFADNTELYKDVFCG